MIVNYRTIEPLRCLVLFLLCSLFCAGPVFAEGRTLIKPHVEVGWQRDSNFHKSDTNEKEVYTYNARPGIEFGYTTEKSTISLDYWANIYKYDDEDDIPAGQVKADSFDYTEHLADFKIQTQATDRLLLGLDNYYTKTRDPASADASSNGVDRYKYSMNRFAPRVVYNFGEKFGLGLKYTNLITDYNDDITSEDSDENRGTANFYYYFNPKTSFDLDYQYWTRDYDKLTSDYDSNQIMLNVSHQFNYFTVTVGAGYHTRDFDQTVATGDISQFVWKASIFGQNPPDAEGVPKHSVYLSVGSNLNDSGSGDTYYNSTRFDGSLTYYAFDRINLTLSGSFQNSDYDTSTREDDRWNVSLAADYYLFHERLSIGVEGGAEDRDSNAAGKDFKNEFVMVNVKFNYDFGSK